MNLVSIVFKILNPIMKAILRSPLHRLVSEKIMTISFTGRKSGRSYSTPVSYYRENGRVYIFTHSTWWENFVGGAEVELRIQGRDYRGLAEPIPDDVERIAQGLRKMFVNVPSDARFYDVTLDEGGEPSQEELIRAAADATMIQIQLDDGGDRKEEWA